MLDVHPPHGKLHGIGDFFLHLFTITIGLLIALALEGAVEHHQKNELRDQAEKSLRQEIRDNQKELSSMLPAFQDEQKSLEGSLAFLAARKQGKAFDVKSIQLGFSNGMLSDASWRTASATGALALMPYDQAQRFAGAYQLQEEFLRLQRATLDDFLLMQSHIIYGFDPTKVTPAEAAAAEPDVTRSLSHLVALGQFAAGLEQTYNKALGDEAGK